MAGRVSPHIKINSICSGFILFLVGYFILSISAAGQSSSKDLIQRFSSSSSPNLKVSFAYSPKYPTEGQVVQFQDSSSGNAASFSWDFGDGTTSTEHNPVHIYRNSGFRKITLTASVNGTTKRASRTITVMPATTGATFVFSPTTPGPGQTVQFADTTSETPVSWRWDFGDGTTSSMKNPSHAYSREGRYTITLVASNSSGSKQGSQTLAVASMSVLTASFNFSPTTPTTAQAVQFTDASTGGPTSWLWNFGDGATSTTQNPSHVYSTAGSKSVTLSVSSSSGSQTSTRTLTVLPALAATFSYSPSSPTTGQTIQFTDTSTGTPTSWSWSFGDGTTSTLQNPSHSFSTA
jgi:PKD repeat protein